MSCRWRQYPLLNQEIYLKQQKCTCIYRHLFFRLGCSAVPRRMQSRKGWIHCKYHWIRGGISAKDLTERSNPSISVLFGLLYEVIVLRDPPYRLERFTVYFWAQNKLHLSIDLAQNRNSLGIPRKIPLRFLFRGSYSEMEWNSNLLWNGNSHTQFRWSCEGIPFKSFWSMSEAQWGAWNTVCQLWKRWALKQFWKPCVEAKYSVAAEYRTFWAIFTFFPVRK